jgi:hypothetical protein
MNGFRINIHKASIIHSQRSNLPSVHQSKIDNIKRHMHVKLKRSARRYRVLICGSQGVAGLERIEIKVILMEAITRSFARSKGVFNRQQQLIHTALPMVPSGLAPDPERRHRSSLVRSALVRRQRAYRGGRRLSGHGSPVAGPQARAPCAGWLAAGSRGFRRGPGRSGRRWCGPLPDLAQENIVKLAAGWVA